MEYDINGIQETMRILLRREVNRHISDKDKFYSSGEYTALINTIHNLSPHCEKSLDNSLRSFRDVILLINKTAN